MQAGRRRAELRPSQGTPSSLPARRPVRPRQQFPRMAGGTAAPQLERAALARGWGGARRLRLFVNSFEFTRLQYGRPYRFVGGARLAEPSLKLGIGEHWRGVASSAKVLSFKQIPGLFHAAVAGLACTIAGSRRERDGCPCCARSRAA
jgi:hypothetical protein